MNSLKPKAVVFDNSGTLIKRYRALKNIKTSEICDYMNSMDIVDYTGNRALVVLQTDPAKCLINAKGDQTIYQFIKNNNVDFDISYSTNDVNKEDVLKSLKQDNSTIKDIQDSIKAVLDKKYNVQICSGSGFIMDMDTNKVEFTITAGGKIFPEVSEVINTLKKMNIDIFIASGDRKGSLKQLAQFISIPPNNVFGTASTKRKKEIVRQLKEKYKVMMVGNGSNDILAFEEADIGVLTLQQEEDVPEKVFSAADVVIYNIREILNINF
ncbi:HAD family hydrolase [Methanobacterium alcaliphilum]|uniref:HAD family hydrolase n=1 Tax=Methanobacterium alcaliphilum TaxID=392018 RepID=UPI00200A3258|nr:HAD family hydrolase [Methanobacterium alcaliphilum]MCK9152353.1 HAD family hydrolase [Methanobacterium alcaliphilum]